MQFVDRGRAEPQRLQADNKIMESAELQINLLTELEESTWPMHAFRRPHWWPMIASSCGPYPDTDYRYLVSVIGADRCCKSDWQPQTRRSDEITLQQHIHMNENVVRMRLFFRIFVWKNRQCSSTLGRCTYIIIFGLRNSEYCAIRTFVLVFLSEIVPSCTWIDILFHNKARHECIVMLESKYHCKRSKLSIINTNNCTPCSSPQ